MLLKEIKYTIGVYLFRLGIAAAKEYCNCVIDSKTKKRKEGIQEKQQRAVQYAQEVTCTSFQILKNIFSSYDVMMMEDLLQGLHFIYEILKDYCQKYPNLWYPNTVRNQRRKYYPRLILSYQCECKALLGDILMFSKHVEHYFADTLNVASLNQAKRFFHAVQFYLEQIVKNPCFQRKQPHYVPKTFVYVNKDLNMFLRDIDDDEGVYV